MALSALMMIKACGVLKSGARIAAMGYPDMLAMPDQIAEMMDKYGADKSKLDYRSDSEKICKRHGKKMRPIADAHSFFSLLGAKLDVFDIVTERGCEILLDLNYPAPQEHLGQYDLVLDVGTLEHCFNVGQAAINMASLLKVGGTIFHQNPFNVGNHGFYGFNPTWYSDFYGQAGYKLIECRLTTENKIYSAPMEDRFKFAEGVEAGLFAMARRETDAVLGFPMQAKYRKMAAAALAA